MINENLPATPSKQRQRVMLITGMSGAGLSTALKALEDVGYEAVDNLRLNLVPELIRVAASEKARPLAIAIDSRNANFSVDELLTLQQTLSDRDNLDAKLMFLTCSIESLQKRFTSTRRRHPLAIDRPLTDGIRAERLMVEKLQDAADLVIDTSDLTIHELRRLVVEHFRPDKAVGLTLFVMSFSYGRGVPREADLVFDARFLKNPHYNPKLRPLTGQDPEIAKYIQTDPDYEPFRANLMKLLLPLLPRYQKEGKSYLTLALGCTGGRHRSVLLAEELATELVKNGYIVTIKHRELTRPPATDLKPQAET
jgi:UPF0042 nucleotide-binding protein